MNELKSTCPHIIYIGDYTKEDIIGKQESDCNLCDNSGPNLWVCLHRDCLFVGCSDSNNNHSINHFQTNNAHSLFLNLTSLRVWCLLCESEVFLENNDPPIPGMLPIHSSNCKSHSSETESDDEYDLDDVHLKPRGLTGLQNLGNTCYMNSAIQALSNCPQLANFFLECGSFVQSEKKPALSKIYMKLVKEMWHKRRPSYVVPSGVAYGIKMVFPVFRGYTQQDAQEFLRCFMDQLHEELKVPIIELPSVSLFSENHDEFVNCHGDPLSGISEESSQSDAEFETCDSGLSSEKTSCIEEIGDASDIIFDQGNIPVSNASLTNNFTKLHIKSFNQEAYLDSKIDSLIEKENSSSYTNKKNDSISDSGIHCNDGSYEANFPTRKPKNYLHRGDNFISSTYNRGTCANWQISKQRHGTSSHNILKSVFSSRKCKTLQYRSIISDIFDGKILSSVQCLTCDTISTTKETFQDLSLPIPNRDHLSMIHASQGNQQKNGTCTDVYHHQGWFSWLFGWMLSWFWGPAVTLQDCLAAFFSADELKGDNMYSCEKCRKLRNGIKYSKVIELPEVLCIHLKRFRHEVMFSSKINNYVSFPLEGLDMSPFLHKSYPCGVTIYNLAAVICHHGTAGSGHYTTYALNYLNEQWYEFDDQYVTAVDAEIVQHCEAYVLFYRKSDVEMIRKRQCAVELMNRSKNEQYLLKFHISKQWVNKFNNFAEPGPISNTDFLCIHGGVPPEKAFYAEQLCTVLPQAVWEYLHDTFGGGPSCTHLYLCSICQTEQDNLNQRRKLELDQFIAMNAQFQAEDNPAIVFAISMNWFKMWERFVRQKEKEPPGPIDNSSICYVNKNQAYLKLGSDYGSLSEDMWHYFLNIYGGGPEIALQPNATNSHATSSSINCIKDECKLISQNNHMHNYYGQTQKSNLSTN